MSVAVSEPRFVQYVRESTSVAGLRKALAVATKEIGFEYFALNCEMGIPSMSHAALLLHNYPREWEQIYELENLSEIDPIRRAGRNVARGFRWREARSLTRFSGRDASILKRAKSFGIVDGFTVPSALPAGAFGTVSFATGRDQPFPETLFLAQSIGVSAFQVALDNFGSKPSTTHPTLTRRQLEAVSWVGRGRTDQQIAFEMGITVGCVVKHLRDARIRWNLPSRVMLPLLAIRAGYLRFSDLDL